MLALDQGSIGHGAQLLASYSAGLAIPFLIAAVAIGSVTKIICAIEKQCIMWKSRWGCIDHRWCIMLFLGIFEQMARFGFFIDFGL
jgi:cytochrome c-type biogenesis protein